MGQTEEIYGEETSTVDSNCGRKKNKGVDECTDDKRISNYSCSEDERVAQILMAQEV